MIGTSVDTSSEFLRCRIDFRYKVRSKLGMELTVSFKAAINNLPLKRLSPSLPTVPPRRNTVIININFSDSLPAFAVRRCLPGGQI